jgi:hypothetical protein
MNSITRAPVGNRLPTDDIKRFTTAAFTAIPRGRWEVAAELFSKAHLECLVMASKPRPDAPKPGSLVDGYLELAKRATDPQAKAHWEALATEESFATH